MNGKTVKGGQRTAVTGGQFNGDGTNISGRWHATKAQCIGIKV